MVGPKMVATAAHQKQSASGEGTIMPCNYCQQMWTLEVTWDVAGTTVTDTLGPQNVECVF
jgi:hypothetical protein